MAGLFTPPFFDVGSGISPSDGAKLSFKIVGSDTNKDTYTTAAADVEHSNPVIADSVGVFAQIFLLGDYDWILTDKNNVQISEGSVSEFAKTSDNPNEDAFTKNFATQALAVADAALVDGDAVNLAEHTAGFGGGAMWDVVLASSVSIDGKGIVACTGVPTLALVLRVNTPHFYPEWIGAKGDSTSDDGALILYALATNLRVTLNPDKIYGTTLEIPIRSEQRLHGGTRSYLSASKASSIRWLGVSTPTVAVVYMANNDTRMTQNTESTAFAECENILIDGAGVAEVGWYSNFTSSGTVIKQIYVQNTLKCGIMISLCFYTELDYITARGNDGAGVALGQYDGTGLMYSGGDASLNGLGNVNVEGHTCGRDLAFDALTNNDTGFGVGLFGTINKCKFIVTSEANEGSAIHENVNNGEFDIYGYVESSAKNDGDPGRYSIHLLGSPSISAKCTFDVQLRTNQRIEVTQNSRSYNLKLDGGDTGTGVTGNAATNYTIDPKSRFNYTAMAPNTTTLDRVLASGIVNLNQATTFVPSFFLKVSDKTTVKLRFVMLDATADVNDFNVRVSVNGSIITTKSIDLDNLSKYDVVETTLVDDEGYFELLGTQSIAAVADAYFEIVAQEVTNAIYK